MSKCHIVVNHVAAKMCSGSYLFTIATSFSEGITSNISMIFLKILTSDAADVVKDFCSFSSVNHFASQSKTICAI